ncbi:MAG: hypothetical protein AB1389_10620 [Campylobacterota bacterium]
MTLLLVSSYKKVDTNEYVELLADEYMKKGIQVIFEEQNFLYSNFIPDIIHIQWPESIYRWKKLLQMDTEGLKLLENRINWYKQNKTKIVYTVHNLQPHDNCETFDLEVYGVFLRNADIIVHHGKNSIKLIQDKYKETINSKHIVAPHGSYPVQKLIEKNIAQKKYAIPDNKIIFTNFGLQRSYKGGDFNLEVFKALNYKDICYFCAGMLVGDTKPFEIDQDELCTRQLYKKISPEELKDIISATDVFFLGHSSGLNSGLIHLAISYSKPIIFPDIGNFKEQADGFEFFETYEVANVESSIRAINRMLKKLEQNKNKIFNNLEWLNKNSWENHVNMILNEL